MKELAVPRDLGGVNDAPAALRRLHEISGLSWGQVARLNGISRRSLHAWLTGTRPHPPNLERLALVMHRVEAVQATAGERTRDALMLPRAGGGPSLFDTMVAEVPPAVEGEESSVAGIPPALPQPELSLRAMLDAVYLDSPTEGVVRWVGCIKGQLKRSNE